MRTPHTYILIGGVFYYRISQESEAIFHDEIYTHNANKHYVVLQLPNSIRMDDSEDSENS